MHQVDRPSNAGHGLAALVAAVSSAALALQYVLVGIDRVLARAGPRHTAA